MKNVLRTETDLPIEKCIVCGGLLFSPLITIGPWSVLECQECGHGVVSPFPDRKKLTQSYNDAYFDERYHKPLDRNDPNFIRRIRQETHRTRFVNRFYKQGRLLDIGCGCGYFLFAASKAGLETIGADVTETNRHYIETELGEELLVGELKNLPLEPETFDVITLWHTLEHHPDPAATVQQCMQWLKKKGVLIVEVPNHNSIDAKQYGSSWPNWDLPFHLHHFSEESLQRLFQGTGTRVLATKTYHSQYIRQRLERTYILKPFARLIATWYKGGSVLMACQKQ